MTFKEFVKATGYSPVSIAQSFLYAPSKRIERLAKHMKFKPTKQDKTNMRYMVAGTKTFDELYKDAA